MKKVFITSGPGLWTNIKLNFKDEPSDELFVHFLILNDSGNVYEHLKSMTDILLAILYACM